MGWSRARTFLAALLASRCVAAFLDARGHAATAPGFDGELRAVASAASAEQAGIILAAAANASQLSETRFAGQLATGTTQRTQALANINLAAEMQLRSAKQGLAAARRASADEATGVAAREVSGVQSAAEAEIRGLVGMAKQLEAEAQQRTSDAMEAAAATNAASVAASGWRAQWPRGELENAVNLGKAVNQTSPHMRDLAASAERVAALVDDVAADTRATIAEALERARNADVLARTAVDQAAQNSLKLTAIRQLVLDAQSKVLQTHSSLGDAAVSGR